MLHTAAPPPACCGVSGPKSNRDQGGTTDNYADHILTKIAADNYISEQTGELSILLTIEQRWPVVFASTGQTNNDEQFSSHLL